MVRFDDQTRSIDGSLGRIMVAIGLDGIKEKDGENGINLEMN